MHQHGKQLLRLTNILHLISKFQTYFLTMDVKGADRGIGSYKLNMNELHDYVQKLSKEIKSSKECVQLSALQVLIDDLQCPEEQRSLAKVMEHSGPLLSTLVQLCSSKNLHIRLPALNIIALTSNLIICPPGLRKEGIRPLLEIVKSSPNRFNMKHTTSKIIQNASFALGNFIRDMDGAEKMKFVDMGGISAIRKVVRHKTPILILANMESILTNKA